MHSNSMEVPDTQESKLKNATHSRETNHGNSLITKMIRAANSGVHWKMMKRMTIQSGLTSIPRKKLATFSDVKFLTRPR